MPFYDPFSTVYKNCHEINVCSSEYRLVKGYVNWERQCPRAEIFRTHMPTKQIQISSTNIIKDPHQNRRWSKVEICEAFWQHCVFYSQLKLSVRSMFLEGPGLLTL